MSSAANTMLKFDKKGKIVRPNTKAVFLDVDVVQAFKEHYAHLGVPMAPNISLLLRMILTTPGVIEAMHKRNPVIQYNGRQRW